MKQVRRFRASGLAAIPLTAGQMLTGTKAIFYHETMKETFAQGKVSNGE